MEFKRILDENGNDKFPLTWEEFQYLCRENKEILIKNDPESEKKWNEIIGDENAVSHVS